MTVERELVSLLGRAAVLPGTAPGYSSDETEGRGVTGRADAIVLPRTTEEVARTLRWSRPPEFESIKIHTTPYIATRFTQL